MTFVTTGFARVLIAGVYGWRDLLSLQHIAQSVRKQTSAKGQSRA